MPQGTAARFGPPAVLHDPIGQPPPERRVGDRDDQGVPRREIFQPGRSVFDPRRFSRWRVLPTEGQKQGATADGDGPSQEWKTKRTECGTFEVELPQQRRDDDLLPGRQQARRGDGTGSVTGENEIGTTDQFHEIGGDALVFVDSCGFVGIPPRLEAARVDPAGMDVRRAGMTYQRDAGLGRMGALHISEGTPILIADPNLKRDSCATMQASPGR